MVKSTIKVDAIQNKLVKAVSVNNTEEIKRLIAKGADVNGQNKYGMTPLLTAVSYSRVESVKLLLELGADPNLGVDGYVDYGYKLPTYDTPLHFAEWGADSSVPKIADDHMQMVKLLEQYGAVEKTEI